MISTITGILFPVVMLLALGATLRRIGFFDEAFASKLLSLVFYTALPCMLAGSISRAGSLEGVGAATAALCGTAVAVCVLAALLARPLGIPRSSVPSFCQTAFRSNAAYVGVPVIMLATAGTAIGDEAMRVAMLTLAAYSVLCNVGAVLLLAGGNGGRGESRRSHALRIVREMAENPLIVGALAGLALLGLRRGCGVELPEPASKTMSILGAMATPGALLALGASLTAGKLRSAFRSAALAVVFKLVVCPLLGAAAAAALSLPPAHRLAVLLYLACPCSTSSFIMDKTMGGDADLSGAAVVLSTALCAVSIAIVLLCCAVR